jgi:hypothetical protein
LIVVDLRDTSGLIVTAKIRFPVVGILVSAILGNELGHLTG